MVTEQVHMMAPSTVKTDAGKDSKTTEAGKSDKQVCSKGETIGKNGITTEE